jgi:hypothetical protein
MSAIKSGNAGSAASPDHPERKGQLGANWEKENQGSAPRGPGPRDQAGSTDARELKTPENKKRYSQRD